MQTNITKKKFVIIHEDDDLHIPEQDYDKLTKLFETCEIRGDYNYAELTMKKIPESQVDYLRDQYDRHGTKMTVDEAIRQLGLDKQLTEEEIDKQIDEMIKSLPTNTTTSLGKLMGEASRRFRGKANMESVSKKIKEKTNV